MKKFTLLFPLISLLLSFSCSDNNNDSFESTQKVAEKYQTKNVVLLVVDGPRISETWEAANKENIPNRINLLQQGVLSVTLKIMVQPILIRDIVQCVVESMNPYKITEKSCQAFHR